MASFWNGSGSVVRTDGTRIGLTVWQAARSAGVKILSTDHDTHDQGMADSIQACLAKNGENSATANLPMGTFRHTGVGNASARNHYAAAGQIQDQGLVYCGTSAGSANAQTVSFTPAVTALTAGLKGCFLAGYTNTGATTLAINGLSTKSFRTLRGNALVGNEIIAGNYYEFVYDGTYIVLTNFSQTDWIDYTPTLGASASMTYTSTTINFARYRVLDGAVEVQADITGTVGGTPDKTLTCTLPITATSSNNLAFACGVSEGTFVGGVAFLSSSIVQVRKVDASNYSAGTVAYSFNGVYKI